MSIKLVVFDVAGTTLKDDDQVVANCFNEALQLNGIHLKNGEINTVMGYRKIDAIKMLLTQKNIDHTDKTVSEIHDDFLGLINRHYETTPIEEIKGTSQMFEDMRKAGIKVALDTGFSRSTTDIIINRMKWKKNGLIDASVTSDEVKEGRPTSYMIQKIMKELDMEDMSEVAKVGDTPSDLMEGENAGCGLTVGVLYGTHTKEELEKYHHDYLIETIEDLKPLIGLE